MDGGLSSAVSSAEIRAVGEVRVQRGFIVICTESSVVEAGGFSNPRSCPTFLTTMRPHFLFFFTRSFSWWTRRLPSAAVSLSVGESHEKNIQTIDFSVDARKCTFSGNSISPLYVNELSPDCWR